jgi:hypothetical protein
VVSLRGPPQTEIGIFSNETPDIVSRLHLETSCRRQVSVPIARRLNALLAIDKANIQSMTATDMKHSIITKIIRAYFHPKLLRLFRPAVVVQRATWCPSTPYLSFLLVINHMCQSVFPFKIAQIVTLPQYSTSRITCNFLAGDKLSNASFKSHEGSCILLRRMETATLESLPFECCALAS